MRHPSRPVRHRIRLFLLERGYEETAGRLVDLPPEWVETIKRIDGYTVVSPERTAGLIGAVEYVARAGIPGAVVECGVWRGGSAMAAAETLVRANDKREVWLYDTFEGMTRPGDIDVNYNGRRELDNWTAGQQREHLGSGTTEEEVRCAVASTGYDMTLVRLVRGPVESTIPENVPAEIAILRLDTDWYASTKHELEHLYPRLSPGGVLIIDDYGHFKGARTAVDEYFAAKPRYLARLDYTGRVLVKP